MSSASGAGVNCQFGYLNGVPYFGKDLNGDGDKLDTVRMLAPSTTQTHRSVVASRSRRGRVRCSTCSWCRNVRISIWRAARECADVRLSPLSLTGSTRLGARL